MNNTELTRNPKAVLDNLSTQVEVLAERIDAILDDISEDFFGTNIDDELGRNVLLFNFNHFRIKSDIVREYAFNLKQTSAELNAATNYVFKILKGIEENKAKKEASGA